MLLFIPKLGTRLRLIEDWRFTLHWDHGNANVWQSLGYGLQGDAKLTVLPRLTVLVLECIYVRKARAEFDSLTFIIKDCPDARLRAITDRGMARGILRFWTSLAESHTMNVEVIEPKLGKP